MTRKARRLLLWILCAAEAVSVLLTVCAVRRVNPKNPPQLRVLEPGSVRSVPGPLDLNTATAAELEALPGVGPSLAESLLAWREEHGAFQDREDVLSVPGIGESTYEKIQPYITYGP